MKLLFLLFLVPILSGLSPASYLEYKSFSKNEKFEALKQRFLLEEWSDFGQSLEERLSNIRAEISPLLDLGDDKKKILDMILIQLLIMERKFDEAEQNLAAFSQENSDFIRGRYYYFRGVIASYKQKPDIAVEFYKKSLDYSREIERYRLLYSISDQEILRGHNDQAVSYIKEGLQLMKAYKPALSKLTHQLGWAYSNKGDMALGIDNLFKALDIYRELGDNQGVVWALSDIASAKEELGKYDDALLYYKAAEKFFSDKVSARRRAIVLGNIFYTYFSKKKNFKEAELYYHKAIKMSQEVRHKIYLQTVFANLDIERNRPMAGLKTLDSLKSIPKEHWNSFLKHRYLEAYFLAYIKMNKVKEAETYFIESESLLDEIGRSDIDILHFKNGAKLYKMMENLEKEFLYYKKWRELKDKIDIEKNKKLLYVRENKTLSLKNQLLQKENKIKDLQLRQRNIVSILLVLLLISLVIVFTLNYLSMRKSKLLQAEKLNTEIRTQSLHSQMKPHFLFNCLNSIMYLMDDSNREASEAIRMLSDLYRHILRGAKSYTWPLKDEIELLKSYLNLQLLRFEDRLTYIIDYENVNVKVMRCPCLMLHTIVENSIKHAIGVNPNGGVVSVKLKPVRSGIKVVIKDSGPGELGRALQEKIEKKSGTGTGLINTQKRLENMYGEKSAFKAKFNNEGSEIQFWISGKALTKDEASLSNNI